MTRSVKAVFLFLCAMTLLLLTASAMLAESPPPPKIISVTPNADGSALVVVQGGNNFMPSEGPPAGWFEFYPRYGPNPASGTGPFDANHGNLYTVPNHSAILSVVSYDPANNTTTYRLSLQQGDLANNAQIGDQVTMVITQCVGSDDNQSGPSNAVTITVGDPNTAYSEDSEPGNTETPGPTPDPTPEPTPVPTPEPTPVPTPVPTPEPTPEPTPVPTPTAAPTEPPYVPIPTPTPPILVPTPTPHHQHVWNHHARRAPTCTRAGYSEYWVCECGATKNYQSLPALGHLWGTEWYVKSDSSGHPIHYHQCTRPGCTATKDREPCVFRRDEYGNIVTEAFNKEMVKQDKPLYAAQKGPAGYTWDTVDPAKMTSHELEAQETAVCTVCGQRCLVKASPYAVIATPKPTGEVYALIPTPSPKPTPHQHDWAIMFKKEPTCTEPGYSNYYKCRTCGEIKGYYELPPSHFWSEKWYVGCNSSGHPVHHQKCIRCEAASEYEPCVYERDENGKIVTETLTGEQMHGFGGFGEKVYNLQKTPAGYAASSLTRYKNPLGFAIFDRKLKLDAARCTVCGNYVLVDSLPEDLKLHTPTPPPLVLLPTPAPTAVPPHEHNWSAAPGVPSTCIRAGWTEYRYCAVCGISEGRQSLPLGEHAWEDVPERESTCFLAGYTAHKRCTVCGATEGKEELPKEHKWSEEWVQEGNAGRTISSGSAVVFLAPDSVEYMKSEEYQDAMGTIHDTGRIHYKPCLYYATCGAKTEEGACVLQRDSMGMPVTKKENGAIFGICEGCGGTLRLPSNIPGNK